jgi:IS1 family transposase
MMIQAPPSGSKGGLLLAWKTDINIASLFVSSNIISVWYYSVDPIVKCLFSFVYGPPYKKTNSDFWMALANFGYSYSDPWICI